MVSVSWLAGSPTRPYAVSATLLFVAVRTQLLLARCSAVGADIWLAECSRRVSRTATLPATNRWPDMGEDWQERWEQGARALYLAELTRQVTYALAAIDQALKVGKDPNGSEVWPSVQTFLTAAANVSKLLWPATRGKNDDKIGWRKFRSERLRSELDIADSSALRSRTVRDSADHFDERLDDLARDQQIPKTWTGLQDETFVHLPTPVRAINSEKGIVIAGHDEVAFVRVVDELKALLKRCAEIEPRAVGRPDVVGMLATLRWPPLPSIFAPSERPDEPVTVGVEVDRSSRRPSKS